MKLGENIYRLRTERHMSQGDLADALDVSRQSVSKWENNSAVPDLDKLVKMKELFGVSLDELVTGEETTVSTPVSPSPASGHSLKLREVIGAVMLCLAAILLIISLILSDYWAEAGVYGSLLLATIGCACCWPEKLAVLLSIFAVDALFLLVLAVYGDPASAVIFAVPFLIIFIVLIYQKSSDDTTEGTP